MLPLIVIQKRGFSAFIEQWNTESQNSQVNGLPFSDSTPDFHTITNTLTHSTTELLTRAPKLVRNLKIPSTSKAREYGRKITKFRKTMKLKTLGFS